ncbi:hypothetical protein KY327_02545 [Candidatus Woesearchaeota archaeon]|nr:hypothetical protein [Candidatus Woesearchaeota archaeon]
MKTHIGKKGMEGYMIGIILAILVIVAVLALFQGQSSGIVEFFKSLRP